MIVYNITIKIDPAIEQDWVRWQKTVHIPEIMNTNHFIDFRFYRLLDQDETEGTTFVIQFFCSTAAHLDEYLRNSSSIFSEKAFLKWGNQFIAFRTTMETVQ